MLKKRDKGLSNPQILLTAVILVVIIALLLSVYYKTSVEEKNNGEELKIKEPPSPEKENIKPLSPEEVEKLKKEGILPEK